MPREDSTKPKRYSHSVHRFSFLPPQGWQVVEPGPGDAVVAFIGPRKGVGSPYMSVEVHDAKGLTLKEYDKLSKERAKKILEGYALVSERDAKTGNLRGHEVRITFKRNRLPVFARIFYGINRGRLYVVTCMTFRQMADQYAAAFDKALNTFRVW